MTSGTALMTDRYELTMLDAALADGTAHRRCTFEVFARSLPHGRRYGVVAGVARVIEALGRFGFGEEGIGAPRGTGSISRRTLEPLASTQFGGEILGYPEGELYFPGSPILSVTGTFAECVLLETLVLSILNHDCAIASAAARMTTAAAGRRLIEMGSRRTHEEAAVAAGRAAYLAGFDATSNLEAAARYGVPTTGTSAHSFTLLADTYDITEGIETAVRVAGPELGAVRIDSGDLGVMAQRARAQLDSLGATSTRVVLSGDLDEHAIAGLRAEPVDAYGVGTSVVT